MYYHVLHSLESKFQTLQQCQEYVNATPFITPKVPKTALPDENQTTPRICVGKTIEDCFTGIGLLGAFRRCLNKNPDTKSYENDDEIYPVIICEFHDDIPENKYVTPTETQLPDIKTTNEKWLLKPTKPSKIYIKWLNAYSIDFDSETMVCKHVTFVPNTIGKNHPWLNQKGHPLDCSDLGNDTWPDNKTKQIWHPKALQFLYLAGNHYVFATPVTNCYAKCIELQPGEHGLEQTGDIYLRPIDTLRPYSGFNDETGRPLFEDDRIHYRDSQDTVPGCIIRENNAWYVYTIVKSKPQKIDMFAFTITSPETRNLKNITLISNTHSERKKLTP